jgi:hypothetical protein
MRWRCEPRLANRTKFRLPAALMRPFLPSVIIALAALALIPTGFAAAPAPERFTFIAIGCVPYARYDTDGAAYARMLTEINRLAPAFTVHLGDLNASSENVNDALLRKRLAEFGTLNGPLIYTPGDNEWSDTHTAQAGGYDPLERLAKIRELFFAEEKSLGKTTIPLVSQRRDEAHKKFVENTRWTRSGVVFATVHAVGSTNNNQPNVPGAVSEYQARDAANAAWIRATFAEARTANAPGVALLFQADPFAADANQPGYRSGFELFLKTIEEEARAYAKPVLLVHADEHRYRLDFGMRFTQGAEPLPNVTRLETFGEMNMHGVLVVVDPASAQVFLPGPLLVPGNGVPQLPAAPRGRGAPGRGGPGPARGAPPARGPAAP